MRSHFGKLLMFGSLTLGGCVAPLPRPSGVTTQDVRVVDAVKSVNVESGLSAGVTIGATQSVIVSGDTSYVGLVGTSVTGGTLTVALVDRFQASPGDALRIQIVATGPLAGLSTSGGAQLIAQGLAGDALALDASGGSTLVVAGTAGRLDAMASGAAHLEARGVAARDVTVAGSGASLTEVCAQESLDLHLSGASRALYSCAPTSVTTDLSGGSTAEPK
jgi:hypothetical protein